MLGDYLRKLSGAERAIFALIILFFILNISLLAVSFMADENDLRQMVNMARYMSYLKYVIILNIALFFTIILIYHIRLRNQKRTSREHEETSTRLKSILHNTKN